MSDVSTLSGPNGAPSDIDFETGHKIRTNDPATDGRFTLTDILGKGGMNVVYLAVDNKTGEEYAVRRFDFGKIPKQELRERGRNRMKREVQMMKELQHPNLPLFIAELEESGDGYIVMERVTGNELTHIIRSAAQSHQAVTPTGSYVPWKVIIAFGRQLLSVLDHMHGKGYIHRDIKPANIMFNNLKGTVQVKLIDFGLGKRIDGKEPYDSLTQENQIMGSIEYMPPEQVVDAKRADHRADLYAIGAVLYEMVTGRKPIDMTGASTDQEAFGRLAVAFSAPFSPDLYPSKFVENMNPELERLILDLFERDPDKRPQTAAETLKRFEAAIASEARQLSVPSSPIISTPPPAAPPSSPVYESVPPVVPTHGNKKPGIAIVALVLLAIASAAVYMALKWQSSPTKVAASAAPSAAPSVTVLAPSAAPVAMTSAVPSAGPSTAAVTLVRKDQLSAKEQATLAAVRAQLTSGGECHPTTKRELMAITDKWSNFPDAYYWLGECSSRIKDAGGAVAYYKGRYASLTGGDTPPP